MNKFRLARRIIEAVKDGGWAYGITVRYTRTNGHKRELVIFERKKDSMYAGPEVIRIPFWFGIKEVKNGGSKG